MNAVEELREIAQALRTTNALRGRQLSDCANTVERQLASAQAEVAARDAEIAELKYRLRAWQDTEAERNAKILAVVEAARKVAASTDADGPVFFLGKALAALDGTTEVKL